MSIWRDEKGISEEFSSITAIIVVVIGISIYFSIVGEIYIANKDIANRTEKYEMADYIFNKLFSPDGPLYKNRVITGGGEVDKNKFSKFSNGPVPDFNGIKYQLILSFNGERIKWGTLSYGEKIAISKNVPVYIDEAHTIPGKLTVVIGGEND